MKAPREWNDEIELFEAVGQALENQKGDGIIERVAWEDVRDSYGNYGYIRITTTDGRVFTLDLYEEIR